MNLMETVKIVINILLWGKIILFDKYVSPKCQNALKYIVPNRKATGQRLTQMG